LSNVHDQVTPEQAALIERAPLFFVASAAPGLTPGPDGVGPVNVSPRGGVPLVVLDPHRVAWLDHRGSGNETARHAAAGGAVTVMACSFEEGEAAIVRLYGTARAVPLEESELTERLIAGAHVDLGKPRQVIEVAVERTMTSCGYGVPVMQLVRERRREDRGRRYK
jgi:hypothetical protein